MNAEIFEFPGETPPRKCATQGVTTVIELQSLNERLLVDGYTAGRQNQLDITQTDPAYHHGYLNGLVDGGHAQISDAQALLARDYVKSGTLRVDVARWSAAGCSMTQPAH